MSEIALNFFPLVTDQFTITAYCLPFVENCRPSIGDEEAVRRYIVIDGEGDSHWTLFQRTEDGTKVVCDSFDNIYLTIAALRLALIQSCTKELDADRFSTLDNYRRGVEILMAEYPEGRQVISLEPYFLRSKHQFGFLADFRFHPKPEHRGTRRALELSLSLDRNGKANLSYYADRYSKLIAYVKKFHHKIFPLTVPGGQKIIVESRLVQLTPDKLTVKCYVVGSGKEAHSQFMGVRQSGPLKESQNTHLYFVYGPDDYSLSHDLYRALRGDTFPTFPGMTRMFRVPMSKENVNGTTLSDFSVDEINRIRDRIFENAAGRNVVPIVLTPFSKHDAPEQNAEYWKLKHAFLSKGVPIQVVATETVADKDKLKWSVASLGLQIFAKLGGTPWKVRPRTERCLIVGIGQAHRKSEGHIERFFAYSVLTDSSGVFEEVKVLADAKEEADYIQSFSTKLREIFTDYSRRFSSFVVHTTFSVSRDELECIANVLEERRKEQVQPGEFVAIKFNDKNKFFGFAADHNSFVPYESTMTSLSSNEFLVWFEGRQYGRSTLSKKVARPVHVKFTFPHEGLARDQKRAHLQDAINLSGANWRGFNAKSLPISVFYAKLIADYLKGFENQGLSAVDVGILKPWFL